MSALVDLIKKIGIFMIAAQAVIHFAPSQKYEKYIKLIVSIMILIQFLMPVYHMFSGAEWDFSDWEEISFEMDSASEFPTLQQTMPEGMENIENAESSAYIALENIEKEIKSRLNQAISGQGYAVSGVKVNLYTIEDGNAAGIRQYEIDTIRIVVRKINSINKSPAEKNAGGGEKVQIEKIDKIDSVNNIEVKINAASEPEAAPEDKASESESEAAPEDKASASDPKLASEAEPPPPADTTLSSAAQSRQQKEKELRDIFCSVLGMEEENLEVVIYGMDEESSG